MIPDFDEHGLLPPGIHGSTWKEFSDRFGTTQHRRRLLWGLLQALQNLAHAGCTVAYIDGSYVTKKPIPADYDVCWEASGVDPTLLDPVLLSFDNRRAAQKTKYYGELFPARVAAEGPPTFRVFLDFFQIDKSTGNPKGIVRLDLTKLPK